MRIMVTGGTGTVGSQVAQDLLARGVEVYVLSRSGTRIPSGAKLVQGDLREPATVRSALSGMDGLFLLTAIGMTETHEGLMAVNGATDARVKRIAYLSVQNLEQVPGMPHCGAKIPVEMAIKASGIPFTILRANNFFQNDFWNMDALLQHGVYPSPIGDVGLSRVDIRDIAEAACLALVEDAGRNETIDLVGPDVITAQSAAAEWGRALARDVRYGGDDLDAFEQRTLRYLPAVTVYDLRFMYDFFQRCGLRASGEAVARLTTILGRPPRSFASFVQETAAAWTAAA